MHNGTICARHCSESVGDQRVQDLSSRAERGISQSKRGSHKPSSVINQLVEDPSHSFGMTRVKLARGRTVDYIPTETYGNAEPGTRSSRRVVSCDVDLSVPDVPSRLRG